MISSKLTSKSQTTIPQAVRDALHLHPGDEIAYVIEAPGRVVVTRVARDDDPFATFVEWSGDADRDAYGKL